VAEPSRFDTEPGDNGEVSRPGVSALFLRRNGIRHVDEVEAELRVGYKKAGILIPYSGLNVSQLMVNGRHYCRLRLDRPTSDAKYLSPRDSGSQLYIPQGAPFGPELVICEGEFKSLALAEAGVRAVAIGGISSAMPEGELLPDLSKILRKFNPGAVYFQGDADTCFIFEFSLEAVKLAKALPPGCTLRLPRIPITMPNGIDDVRQKLGDEFLAFWEKIKNTATPVPPKLSPSELAASLALQELHPMAMLPNRDTLMSRLTELASYLDPLALDRLARGVTKEFGHPLKTFCEAAKRRATDREAQFAKEWRQQRLQRRKDDQSKLDNASLRSVNQLSAVHTLRQQRATSRSAGHW
jgi:hypothetical protein